MQVVEAGGLKIQLSLQFKAILSQKNKKIFTWVVKTTGHEDQIKANTVSLSDLH